MTRESPWDDASRRAAYDLYDDQLDRCPQCGLPRAECREKDKDWHPQLERCWRTAAQTVANRLWLKKNEKAEPNSAGYLPTDGARVWVSPIDLDPSAPDFLAPDDEITPDALLPLVPADQTMPPTRDPEGGGET